MKHKIVLLLIVISTSLHASEDLSHITDAGGTVYFDYDAESGYQYMGAANAHPGGGYFSHMGGVVTKPDGTGCSDTDSYHNTVRSNETAAQDAVAGSQYALKTPYDGDCTGESSSRDITRISLGDDKTEVYVRWYQKFTGEWNSANNQHKFMKFCGNDYNGTTNGYMTSAHFSFSGGSKSWRAIAMNNRDGQFSEYGDYCDDWESGRPEIEVYQTQAGAGTHWAWDDINNGIDNGNDGETIFTTNRWYCIEIHVKMNTNDQTADGVLEAWVDGTKVFSLSNYKYYVTGQAAFGVGYLEFQHIYYVRSATDQPTYMDNIVVSNKYIGPLTAPQTGGSSGISCSGCGGAGW
jgi:hypothetical protein